ncbi:DUF1453 domain-containing protein [Amycolatopsis sp. CA-230715]|uniref:DUF1453 domain-containing protein n=1 Tax=Amycolatopsis sp. CA-230715 TaxID=2745196 RepID=UPI001C01C748|nr:DUF1453 domain-containing protein [Amycolatopsis sp. CA-230715]QWF84631.1 hypothetical protein HUW46_08082 [Amycolatopsis sp. CA-230715]
MTDALVFSGIFLVLVLTTQIGRRRHSALLAVMPFVSSAVIGGLVIFTGKHDYHLADFVCAVVGAAIGVAVGLGLSKTMAVYRDPGTAKLYTRAAFPYLAIWLVVLVVRIVFVWLLENVHSFAVSFGEFMVDNGIGQDGVALFFLMMALAMVLTREVSVLLRAPKAVAAVPAAA